jgi:hypothetical protein
MSASHSASFFPADAEASLFSCRCSTLALAQLLVEYNDTPRPSTHTPQHSHLPRAMLLLLLLLL